MIEGFFYYNLNILKFVLEKNIIKDDYLKCITCKCICNKE
jgi:hypothetical protein